MQSTATSCKLQPVKLFSTNYSPPDVTDSPPIIFIHGLYATNRTWQNVKCDISNKTKRKIYAIDLRNHGKSEWPKEFSLKLLADDLENFMITEKIPKAVLVGHSLGGRIAIAFAFRKPEMVEKLVIEDMSLEDTEESVEYIHKIASYFRTMKNALKFLPPTMTEIEAQKKFQTYIHNFFPEAVDNLSSANVSVTLPFYKKASGHFAWEIDADNLYTLDSNLELLAVDLSNDPVYQGEMLLLAGDKSGIVKNEDVDKFFKYFPKCQSYFFKGGVHNLHMEFPEKYKEMVTNFIGQ